MAVAGADAVAVIDFHQQAVAGALAGVGDHAGGGGDHFGAVLAGEIHPFVPRHLAGERVGAAAEAARHPALGDGTAGQEGLVFQITVGEQVLEDVQLLFAALQGLGEAVQLLDERGRREGAAVLGFGAAHGQLAAAEVEFVAFDAGHVHQPLAEGVQAHQAGLGVGQLEGQGTELFFTELFEVRYFIALPLQGGLEAFRHLLTVGRRRDPVADPVGADTGGHGNQHQHRQHQRGQKPR